MRLITTINAHVNIVIREIEYMSYTFSLSLTAPVLCHFDSANTIYLIFPFKFMANFLVIPTIHAERGQDLLKCQPFRFGRYISRFISEDDLLHCLREYFVRHAFPFLFAV